MSIEFAQYLEEQTPRDLMLFQRQLEMELRTDISTKRVETQDWVSWFIDDELIRRGLGAAAESFRGMRMFRGHVLAEYRSEFRGTTKVLATVI